MTLNPKYEIEIHRPVVYIASPYSKGDPAINTRFQCQVFDDLMDEGLCWPVAPLWSHFQHTLFPRNYTDWIKYDLAMIARYDACIRLTARNQDMNYFIYDSSGADGEVKEFLKQGKPVFYTMLDLNQWLLEQFRINSILKVPQHD
jgi:hypothetical protein